MKRLFWMVILLALLAGGGYFGYRRVSAQASEGQPSFQTAEVQRGTIEASVLGAGNLAPGQARSLSLGLGGTVASVRVEEGDRVRAGQVLVELDTTDLELEVAKARLQVQSAQASLAKARAGATAEELAAAQAGVQSAQANLAGLWQKPSEAQLAAARAALAAAERAYADLQARPDPEDVEQARLQLDQANNSLWGAQLSRGSTCGAAIEGRGSQGSCDSAEASVLNAEVAVQLAQMAYEQAQRTATEEELQAALAQVERARYDLEQLLEGPDPAAVAAAQAQLESARSQLAQLAAGPSAEDIAIAESQLEQARLTLRQAQRNLARARLVAPFEGTVTSVGVGPGDQVSSGAVAVELADLSSLQIEVPLSEFDLPGVEPGQRATVTVDALSDEPLRGRVSAVAPVATMEQGVVNYLVRVDLDEAPPSVRPGMTASVSITTQRREGVLLVPNRAVQTLGQGKMVIVQRDGRAAPVRVETGLSDESMTEVAGGGLREGEVVLIPTASTLAAGAQAGQGPPGGFFFPGGGRVVRPGGGAGGQRHP